MLNLSSLSFKKTKLMFLSTNVNKIVYQLKSMTRMRQYDNYFTGQVKRLHNTLQAHFEITGKMSTAQFYNTTLSQIYVLH